MPGKKKKAAPKAAAAAAEKPVAAAAARKQAPAAPVAAVAAAAAQQTAAKSEEVANTLATVLNMFPQTHAGVIQSLYRTARGSALIQSIHFQKPFAEVKAAFSACDPKRDLNAVDDNGDSALHRAAALDNVDAIKLLLSGGANMRQSNYNGQMPFHLAAFFGRAAAVNEFARRGMDVNATNNQGESALLIAAYFNHRDVITTLLRYNPDAGLPDFRGNTALRVAKNDGRIAIQKYVTAKDDAKRRADNPVPGVVTAVVQATRPFAAKLAALKLEASAPNTATLLATAQGGAAQPPTAALSAQRCALSSCGKNDVVLKGCGRCRLVAYCTKEHQIADFKEHKSWCLHVKDVRDNVDAVCDVTRPPNERAAATQRLGVPFESTVIVAVNAIDALLAAVAKDTDPKLPALIALRYLLLSGSAVDEDLTARFLLANGLTVVLNALLNSASVAVTPEAVLDNARFLMAVARRHRLARLIITHYLSAPAAVAAARAANGTAANGASAAAPTNPGLTAAQADANVALLCRLTTYSSGGAGGGSDRVANLSVGMLALLCEVDDLHVHSGLSARVAQHCPAESLKLAQRLLKIDAVIASKAAAAVSAANTPARNKSATPPPV